MPEHGGRDVDADYFVDAYTRQRLTCDEIAAATGLSVRTVYRRLVEHGIPTRSRAARPGHRDRYDRPARTLTEPFLADAYVQRSLTVRQIAAEVGCHPDTVSRHLCRHGIEPRGLRPPPPHLINIQDVAALRAGGLTLADIARQLGYSKRTLERRLFELRLQRPT